jgi:hypothetical protein
MSAPGIRIDKFVIGLPHRHRSLAQQLVVTLKLADSAESIAVRFPPDYRFATSRSCVQAN